MSDFWIWVLVILGFIGTGVLGSIFGNNGKK